MLHTQVHFSFANCFVFALCAWQLAKCTRQKSTPRDRDGDGDGDGDGDSCQTEGSAQGREGGCMEEKGCARWNSVKWKKSARCACWFKQQQMHFDEVLAVDPPHTFTLDTHREWERERQRHLHTLTCSHTEPLSLGLNGLYVHNVYLLSRLLRPFFTCEDFARTLEISFVKCNSI